MCRSVVTTSSVSLGGDARASPETAGSDNLPLDASNATKAPVPTQSNGAISRRQLVLLTVVFLDTLGRDSWAFEDGSGAYQSATALQALASYSR